MRFAEDGEDLTGKVCVCSIGRLGLVTGRKLLWWGGYGWAGVGLDGKGLWCSQNPVILFDSIGQYESRLENLSKINDAQ